ncbi:MAG: Transcriptional regulator, AbrB family [uncultured bacterium]|nr:MAG: Transcriptional regulator, AbrB family [uncultured bacterium]
MLMKIFNKGQVVIPVDIRKQFGITIGDYLDVSLNQEKKCIELHHVEDNFTSKDLAGSLSHYKINKKFPTGSEIKKLFAESLFNAQ